MISGYHYFWKHPYGGYLKNRADIHHGGSRIQIAVEIPRVGVRFLPTLVTWEDDVEDISMTHPSENHDSAKDGEFLSTKISPPKAAKETAGSGNKKLQRKILRRIEGCKAGSYFYLSQ